ncbi:MAG: response regulator transcription factor [Bacteroidaceae bacterium]|nr:response regulator transcription factor [Bacteroidaceae bacterium]
MLLGLKQMLEEVMPFAAFRTFSSTAVMREEQATAHFFHYFVSAADYIANRDFYSQCGHKAIVLIDSEPTTQFNVLNLPFTINMLLPREEILRQLLQMQQMGHSHYRNYPNEIKQAAAKEDESLTRREKEVLQLLAKGMINKEIADKLHISVNTAITHRKHIMQKLHSQSLSKLAIYAVQHGYVQPEEIK